MGSKYFFFLKSSPVEEVYEQTLTFWQKNKGTVEEEKISSDNLIKTLKIHRGMTLTSNGEDYIIDFSYNPRDSRTYIRIEASLVLGYGIQWLTPKKIINKWVSELRIMPTYIVGRTNEEFFDFDKIPRQKSLQLVEIKPRIPPKIESRSTTTQPIANQPKTNSSYQQSVYSQQSDMSQSSHTLESPSVRQDINKQPKTVQKSKVDRFDEFAVRFCTFCGHKNKKISNFCKNCGKKLE